MLIPFGILSAAGAGGAAGVPAFDLLETTILGTAASSVTFSSLGTYSADYKHLQIRYAVRSSRTEVNDGVRVNLNADTGSNYAQHALFGTGASVVSSFQSQVRIMALPIPANTATASAFGGGVIDLLDAFSTSKNKTARGLGGVASSFNQIDLQSGVYISLSALTSIVLTTSTANNFVTGSRFSLYGVKG